MTIIRCGVDMLHELETLLDAQGLSSGRFMTLVIMNRTPDESFTPTQLAEALNVSRATMTGLLDGLESAGLVERGIHQQDRRKMSVQLTPMGVDIMDRLLPAIYRAVSQVLHDFTDEEAEEFFTQLLKVSHGLKKYREESTT